MKWLRCCCVFTLGWLPLAGAQTTDSNALAAAAKIPEYRLAVNALRDRLPEVAALKLTRLLAVGGPNVKGPVRTAVQLLLAEAQVRAGQAAEAKTLTESPELRALPEARFWHAQALGMLGEWREAERDFESLAGLPNFRYARETVFCQAGMQAALGDIPRALRLLAPLLPGPAGGVGGGGEEGVRARLWAAELRLAVGQAQEAAALLTPLSSAPAGWESQLRYVRGRVALALGDAVAAESLFALVTESPGKVPAALRQASQLGRVRALRAGGRSLEALPVLKQLLSLSPAPVPEVLAPAFRELESMNNPPAKEIQTLLTTLAGSQDPRVKARARFALAAALETAALEDPRELPAAEAAWAAIPKELPDSPLLAEALLRQAQFYAAGKRRQEAASVLKKLRALAPGPALLVWADWVAGQADYDAGVYRKAAANFEQSARQSPDPAMRAAAAYNAAVAELQSGGAEPVEELAMLDDSPLAEYRMAGAEFHLERALRMAAKGREEAEEGLKAFVEGLPDHARRFEALMALAELNLRADPPKVGEASRWLEKARAAAGANAAQLERADLLEVYLAEVREGPDALAARATRFLETWPQSAERSDLRMKLGEMYFLRQRYSAAREQFEALEKDDPRSPLAEAALFWAGKAALSALGTGSNDRAIQLWEEVFQRGGKLKWQARLQEALLTQRLQKTETALQLVEEILEAVPAVDQTTRWQALSVRGELLCAPARKEAEIKEGLASFEEIIRDPQVPSAWRQQTLFRKGVCLEALKRTPEALEAYYDILSEPPAAPALPTDPLPDDLWFHKAGDRTSRLLLAAGKNEEAVEIVKKLANAPGPRGRAAADLLNKLLLQHHIYQDSR